MSYQITNLLTLGVEYESSFVVPGSFSVRHFQGTHDGSVDRDVYGLNSGIRFTNLPDALLSPYFPVSRLTIGTEFVSEVLNPEENNLLDTLRNLTYIMELNGGQEIDDRSGYHVHVSLSDPGTRALKSIFRLGMFSERLFYQLAGMGRKFRGFINDATYCRPITKFGPPVIKDQKRHLRQIFDINKLISTEKMSPEEWWIYYADLNSTARQQRRYHPARYLWLNVFNLCPATYRGTLEFRVANTTLNHFYLHAYTLFCVAWTRLASQLKLSDIRRFNLEEENSVFDSGKSSTDILTTLVSLISEGELWVNNDDSIIPTLYKILETSEETKINPGYYFSHVPNPPEVWWANNPDKAPSVLSKNTKVNQVHRSDIHALRNGERAVRRAESTENDEDSENSFEEDVEL